MIHVKFYGGPANGELRFIEKARRVMLVASMCPSFRLRLEAGELPRADDVPIIHNTYRWSGRVTVCHWAGDSYLIRRRFWEAYRYDG